MKNYLLKQRGYTEQAADNNSTDKRFCKTERWRRGLPRHEILTLDCRKQHS